MKRYRYHYHVIENTPGYLPDEPPEVFSRLRDAELYAASLARELRDDGYHVRGSARSGGYYAERGPDDLGRVIEIIPCFESGCLEAGES